MSPSVFLFFQTILSVSNVQIVPAWLTGPIPDLRPGDARPWHADVAASTYSRVNLFNGNVFTVIPIVSWSGTGPDMEFVFYHNSANWDHTPEDTKNVGFFLGPGWSISYSDHILDTNPKVVIREDGTRDSYTWNGTKWVAPAGVYDELVQDSSDPDYWRLKHKDQSFHEFYNGYGDGIMRLQRIVDATGNQATLQYEQVQHPTTQETYIRLKGYDLAGQLPDPFTPRAVVAAGRVLQLIYDDTPGPTWGRLIQILDPGEQNEPAPGVSVADRNWLLEYDSQQTPQFQFLKSIRDPMGYYINIVYATKYLSGQFVPVGRLRMLSDKSETTPGDSYTYWYTTPGHAAKISDPSTGLFQQFTFSGVNPGYYTTQYRDRRGSIWIYRYNDAGESLFPDGNLNRITDPTGVELFFYHDSGRNTDLIYDNASSAWFRDFDVKGNLIWDEDPLGNIRFYVYDAYNNLTQAYDPLGNLTRYCYEKPGYPTLLTKILEPDDFVFPSSPSNCSATGYPTTTIDYYIPGNGQIKEIVDPNGVWTGFDYDLWGQPSLYSEGRYDDVITLEKRSFADGRGFPARFRWHRLIPTGGRAVGDYHMAGGVGTSDDAGNPTSSGCLPPQLRPPGREPERAGLPPGFPRLPCEAPQLPTLCAGFSNAEYSPKGELEELALHLSTEDCGIEHTRTFLNEYNQLGQQTLAKITSNESGAVVQRSFSYTYNFTSGTVNRSGPDGVQTTVQLDTANRVASLLRGPSGSIVSATYTYGTTPKLGLIASITYGNGMVESYLYDDAYRVTEIKYVSGGQTVLQLNFYYSADSLPLMVEETGTLSDEATVTFTYDRRRRLTSEVKAGATNSYNYSYEYDKGGNRTTKRQRDPNGSEFRRTDYFYDLPTVQHGVTINPADFSSNNNRLLYYKVYNTTGGGNVLESTTWYFYEDESGLDYGNPTRMVTNLAGTDEYSATRFGYGMNGRTVTYAMGESWSGDGSTCPISYEITWAREFRYDSGRARYLNRQLDTQQLMLGNVVAAPGGDTWTDYDGDTAYGDYEVTSGNPPTVTNKRSYQPGMAVVDPWMSAGSTATDYFVIDHLGTTRGMTLPDGFPDQGAIFTAFGQKITGTNHRYGYVGALGYQAHSEMPYLHVGHRCYDPASGRFLQRDPIGIFGGTNAYEYAGNNPVIFVDPDGLHPARIIAKIIGKILGKGKKPPPKNPPTKKDAPQKAPPPPTVKPPKDWSTKPGPDFVWRGNGPVGSKDGSWFNPNTRETWHPDPHHGPPHGPHWDWTDTSGKKWRVWSDGRCEPK